jgi:hypothetical protein
MALGVRGRKYEGNRGQFSFRKNKDRSSSLMKILCPREKENLFNL